jgi:hypothetical protein
MEAELAFSRKVEPCSKLISAALEHAAKVHFALPKRSVSKETNSNNEFEFSSHAWDLSRGACLCAT